jgi:hypothetical protein
MKVHYLGLKKNTAQIFTLFALYPPVDGATQADGSQTMGAPANRAMEHRRAAMAS